MITFAWLILAWPMESRLARQIRESFAVLTDQQKRDIEGKARDFALKLTIYSGLIPAASILATVVIVDMSTLGVIVAIAALVAVYAVIAPFVLVTKLGHLSDEFARAAPFPESWLRRVKVNSYGSFVTIIYIAAILAIQLTVVILQLPAAANQ